MTQVIQEMDIESMIRILENNPFSRHAIFSHLRSQVNSLRDGEVDEVRENQVQTMLVCLIQILKRIDIGASARVL